jgi:hypothetical protein
MNSRKNVLTGFIIGLLSSLILSYIIFWSNNPGMEDEAYMKIFLKGKLIVPVMSISLLANFGLFFIFIKLYKDDISKGILISTMLIGLVILILKFI